EYHDTLTEQEFSQAAKMSVGMVVNTAGVLFFIYSQPKEWYQDGGFKVRGMQRGQLTDELKEVKAQIEKFKKAWAPSSMNATRRYANALKTFLCCLPSPQRTEGLLGRLYEPVLPLISLVGLIGLCWVLGGSRGMQYWMDKYLLLTWYARPTKPLSADIANFFVRFVKWVGPIFYSVSFFIFVTPSYADKAGDGP
ncbi:unnamed protein product, partial [Symbiodinium necroappetens]